MNSYSRQSGGTSVGGANDGGDDDNVVYGDGDDDGSDNISMSRLRKLIFGGKRGNNNAVFNVMAKRYNVVYRVSPKKTEDGYMRTSVTKTEAIRVMALCIAELRQKIGDLKGVNQDLKEQIKVLRATQQLFLPLQAAPPVKPSQFISEEIIEMLDELVARVKELSALNGTCDSYLTAGQIGEKFGYSPVSILRMARSGAIRRHKHGFRTIRFLVGEVESDLFAQAKLKPVVKFVTGRDDYDDFDP